MLVSDASRNAARCQHGFSEESTLGAGEALAIALGLLLPHAKHQRAVVKRLQLGDLPKLADASLNATFLAERLWPQAAASLAYPQSPLNHGALASGQHSSTHALRLNPMVETCHHLASTPMNYANDQS